MDMEITKEDREAVKTELRRRWSSICPGDHAWLDDEDCDAIADFVAKAERDRLLAQLRNLPDREIIAVCLAIGPAEKEGDIIVKQMGEVRLTAIALADALDKP